MAKSSLEMYPSGYSAGKLYSQRPTNGVGDFTVDRDCEASRINKDGNIEFVSNNVPRLDYSDGGCPVLLTEPQSENLFLNSEILSTQNITTLASTYTVSFYGTGTITLSGSYSGVLVGTGEKDLVQLTFTASAGTLTSTVTGSVLHGQCENLGYATSRIKTLGSSVVRLADKITDAGDVTTFSDTEGTLIVKVAKGDGDQSLNNISITDGTTNNEVRIYPSNTSSSVTMQVDSELNVGGGVVVTFPVYTGTENFNYYAVAWKKNDIRFFNNGVKRDTDTTKDAPINLTRLDLDMYHLLLPFVGKTSEIKVFKHALTDEELEDLTSWLTYNEMANDLKYDII